MADRLVAGIRCADLDGLAAAFVLGALEPEEAARVREHLAGCPEAHAEIVELGSVVPALLESVALVEPPAGLGARIRAAAETVVGTPAPAPIEPRRTAPPEPVPPGRADRHGRGWIDRFRRPIWVPIAAAALVVAVAVGAWNVQLRDQVAALTVYRDGVAAVLAQAGQPGARLAVLAAPGAGSGPSGLAAVATSGSITLVVRDLRPTTGSQVYEAWVIGSDGVPVALGGFDVGAGGTAAFAGHHAGVDLPSTVALTLERGPGATTPTMPLIVAGSTAAASS